MPRLLNLSSWIHAVENISEKAWMTSWNGIPVYDVDNSDGTNTTSPPWPMDASRTCRNAMKNSAHTFVVAKPWDDRIGARPQKLAIVHRRPANRWRRVKGKNLMAIASARLPKLSLSAADSCRYWLPVACNLHDRAHSIKTWR